MNEIKETHEAIIDYRQDQDCLFPCFYYRALFFKSHYEVMYTHKCKILRLVAHWKEKLCLLILP